MLSQLIQWIVANVGEIFAALMALHGFALIVVNLTPTPRDNEILGKIYKVIEWLAGILTRTAKAMPGEGV